MESKLSHSTSRMPNTVTRCVCVKKRPKRSPTRFWVKINAWHSPWKYSLIIRATSVFSKTFQRQQSPDRQKFCQSGHTELPVRSPSVLRSERCKNIALSQLEFNTLRHCWASIVAKNLEKNFMALRRIGCLALDYKEPMGLGRLWYGCSLKGFASKRNCKTIKKICFSPLARKKNLPLTGEINCSTKECVPCTATTCVCAKIIQNEAQTIFCQNLCKTFLWKLVASNLSFFSYFKKLPQVGRVARLGEFSPNWAIVFFGQFF
jgi:hypothetical protein